MLCNESKLPILALVAAAISNQNGLGKVRIKEVAPTDDLYFDCTKTFPVDMELAARLLLVLNSDSEAAFQIGFHADCAAESQVNTCDNKVLNEEALIKSVIGKAGDGTPYLRICLDSL